MRGNHILLCLLIATIGRSATFGQVDRRNFPLDRYAELHDAVRQKTFTGQIKLQWKREKREGEPLTWPRFYENRVGFCYYESEAESSADEQGNHTRYQSVLWRKLADDKAIVETTYYRKSLGSDSDKSDDVRYAVWVGFDFSKLNDGDRITYVGGVQKTQARTLQSMGPDLEQRMHIILEADLPPLPNVIRKKTPQTGPRWPDQPIRIWKDRTGKHEVEASIVDYDRGRVVLKQKDGKTIRVETKVLSADDAKLVRDLLKQSVDSL